MMQIWYQLPARTMQLHGSGKKTNSRYPEIIGSSMYSKGVGARGICSRYRRMETKQEKLWSGLSVENKG